MVSPKHEAAEAAKDVAIELGREGITALKLEAERRREDACIEVARLERKLGRLPRWRWLARAITRGQLNRAIDRCAAMEASRNPNTHE
jgi:hypothetical protein